MMRPPRMLGPLLLLLTAVAAAAAAVDEAFAAKQAGDYPRAIRLYAALVAAEPGNPAHYFQLGTVQGWAGRHGDALATLRRGLELAPHDVDLQLALGRTLAWSGSLAEAEAVFREVLDRQPENLEARNMLGRVLAWRRQFDAAENTYDQILKTAPHNVDALIGRGDVERYQERFDEARTYYERAAAVEPASQDIQQRLASVRRAGRWRLDAGAEISTFAGDLRDDWQGWDATIRYAVDKKTGLAFGREEANRFNLTDVQYTLGVDRRFTDNLQSYARLSATSAADFLARRMAALGGTWQFRPGDLRLPPTLLAADIRVAGYAQGTATSVWLGITQQTAHRLALTAKHLSTRNLNDRWTHGWLARIDGEPSDDWRWHVGYADTTESLSSTVIDFTLARRTRAFFGGCYHEISPALGLRIDITREWSAGGPERHALHAGFTTRF